MTETHTIPARFNGPPGSGHGGYSAALLAGRLGAEEVEVSLRAPLPLERPLRVNRVGETVELRDGDALLAEAVPTELVLDAPPARCRPRRPVPPPRAGYEHWTAQHPFPTCVGCGPGRAPGDGIRLVPGSLGEGRFAAEWTPDESFGDGAGRVRPECVWAALDCPTSAPVANFGEGPPILLARLAARVGPPGADRRAARDRLLATRGGRPEEALRGGPVRLERTRPERLSRTLDRAQARMTMVFRSGGHRRGLDWSEGPTTDEPRPANPRTFGIARR